MTASAQAVFAEFCARLREVLAPHRGKIEYGDLRERVDCWECNSGARTSNVAIVYETPGGSTDQINIAFDHQTGQFTLLTEDAAGECCTDSIAAVLEQIRHRTATIPEKRREHLRAEIRRKIDSGESCSALVGHLNRLLASEFKGGRLTHLEMRDAMTFAVQYSKKQPASP